MGITSKNKNNKNKNKIEVFIYVYGICCVISREGRKRFIKETLYDIYKRHSNVPFLSVYTLAIMTIFIHFITITALSSLEIFGAIVLP